MASQTESTPQDKQTGGMPEAQTSSPLEVRGITKDDYKAVSDLARKNFNGPSFSLFPKDVVQGYISANSVQDVRHAAETEGSEAYVATNMLHDVVGFVLLRHNQVFRRNSYGDVDLRRLHVDPDTQGQGVGKELFSILESRGRDLHASHITSHASGGSRPFFEANGWEGETNFNDMSKRGKARAIVFVASKQLSPKKIELLPTPTHVLYAGANETKAHYVRELVAGIDSDIDFVKHSGAVEDEATTDVVDAALSKALSTANQIAGHGGRLSPLIVAGDVRADLLVIGGGKQSYRYDFLNRGKPRGATTADRVAEVADNFTELFITSDETNRPAPYVIRSATCLLDPKDPDGVKFSTYDTSVWLSTEGLEELATNEGVKKYRDEAMEELNSDILDMSGGFCLPIFLKRGYVKGINGHPLETLPKKDEVIKRALHTAIVGIDPRLLSNRLGIID